MLRTLIYISSSIMLASLSFPTHSQDVISGVTFNGGGDGAVITLGEGVTGTALITDGILNIEAMGVNFRVKCSPVGDSTPENCVVYAGGAGEVPDNDGDGMPDSEDQCDNTPADEIQYINSVGCSPSEFDTDGDGLVDATDFCDNTPANEIDQIDANGCGPSEQTSTAGYCDNAPSTFSCSPLVNFDDFLTSNSQDILLLARQGRSIPFTLPAGSTATGEFYYANNSSIATGYTWKAWISTLPGGAALTSGGYCTYGSTDPNGKGIDWSQVSANAFNCYLGQEERILYLNFGIFDSSNALTYPSNYRFQVDKNVFSQ